MASNVPASLRAADISRFAHRAAQLETVDPVIAYYCKYQVIQTILGRGLHTSSDEATTYTTHMVEQLEQFKEKHPTEEAVTDDTVGKIYVEQFGLKTFRRADTAMRADKVTPQTADTFQAAATFLDLLSIWGKIDPEVMAKIKYAKFHALRIAKAIRAGEDPNLSSPKPEPEVEEEEQRLPALDANDPEVQMLNGGSSLHRQPSVADAPDETDRLQRNLAAKTLTDESLHPSRAPSIPRPRQPSVAGVVDESHLQQHNLAAQSATNESLHPSRAPSVPPTGGSGGDVSPPAANDPASYYTNTTDQPDVSPIEPTPAGRAPSLGGNYFPQVSPPLSQPPPASVDIPSAPITREDNTDLPSSPANIKTSDLSSLPTAPSEPTLPDTPASLSQSGAFAPQPARRQSPTLPSTHHGHFLPQPAPSSSFNQPQIPPNFAPDPTPRQPVPQAPPQLYHPAALPPQPPVHAALTSPFPAPTYPSTAPPPPPPPPATPVAAAVAVDDVAIMQAQKHARWAISALNFEDVGTAVRELKGALEVLGAR